MIKKFLNVVIPLLMSGIFCVSIAAGIYFSLQTPIVQDALSDEDFLSYGLDQDEIDWDASYAGDGMTNREKFDLGLDIYSVDADGDGLPDVLELEIGTDPLKKDTDGDGMDDGVEYTLGLDPLNPDSKGDGVSDGSRDVIYNYIDKSTNVKLNIRGTGNIGYATVDPVPGLDGISGVVGSMYDIHTEGTVQSADITLPYSEDELSSSGSSEGSLSVFHFDPLTKTFEEVESTTDTDSNTVTATVSHFSLYCLADSRFLPHNLKTELMFVIDNTGSMFSPEQAKEYSANQQQQQDYSDFDGNDTEFKRVDLSISIIDKLKNHNFSFGAGKFTFRYSTLSEMGSGVEATKAAISSLKTEKETFDGTYIGEALYNSLFKFSEGAQQKYVVLLTDGDDSVTNQGYSESRLTSAINLAVDRKVAVIVIGLGENVNSSVLNNIATSTGGKYFHASNANLLENLSYLLLSEINYGLADTDGDETEESLVVAQSSFIPAVNGFSFKNFGSAQSPDGNCYGMATFAKYFYEENLPMTLDPLSYTFLLKTWEAQGYNISNAPLTKGNLYSFQIDSRLADFYNPLSSMIEENPDNKGIRRLIEEHKTTFTNLGYQIQEKSVGKAKYEKPLIDIYSEKLSESNVNQSSIDVLQAIYRLFILQKRDTMQHFWNINAAQKTLTSFKEMLENDTIAVMSIGGHAVNGIALYRDLTNPNRLTIAVYDNNHPGEIRYIDLIRSKMFAFDPQRLVYGDYEFKAYYGDEQIRLSIRELESLS